MLPSQAPPTIAASVPAAREGLLTAILEMIEKIVGRVYRTSAAAEIAKLGAQIISGDIDYALTVQILGCTPPVVEGRGAESSIGDGRWGLIDDKAGLYRADVPLAMGHLSSIIAVAWCTAAGGPLGAVPGFGLMSAARMLVNSLPPAKVKETFEDLFTQAAEQAKLRRKREGQSMLDWPLYVQEMGPRKWFALMQVHRAEEAAARTYACAMANGSIVAGGVGGGGGGGGGGNPSGSGAGGKRGDPGIPGKVGEPGSRAAKRAARDAAHKAGKATQGATTPPSTPPIKGGPALVPTIAGSPAAAWIPDFSTNSITMFIDKLNRRGAVEAFDFLCRQANPSLSRQDQPCAFASLATCNAPAAKPCKTCVNQASMATPTPVPAGAVARVKAACVAAVASRIN